MASVHHRRGRWKVRWKEPSIVVGVGGVETRTWRSKERSCPNRKTAERLKVDIERAAAEGIPWRDTRKTPVASIDAIVESFLHASLGKKAQTVRYRASVLQKFVDWAGPKALASDLSATLLRAYADHLRQDHITTVARYVGLVEQVWRWAYDQPSTWPGVPRVEPITGQDREIPHTPAGIATDNPTWRDIDALLQALTPEGASSGGQGHGYRPEWEWHRRVALVQRFSGLRISQILALGWNDIDLDHGQLIIRADAPGAKGQRSDQVVPLHRLLAAELAAWGKRSGPVFARIATKGKERGQVVVPRGSEVADVFAAAWRRAGVPARRWGAVGRERARPTNAIRAAWKSAIAGADSYELAALMVGQAVPGKAEHRSYVVLGNPAASPYWNRMRAALEAIPPIGAVITLTSAASRSSP